MNDIEEWEFTLFVIEECKIMEWSSPERLPILLSFLKQDVIFFRMSLIFESIH